MDKLDYGILGLLAFVVAVLFLGFVPVQVEPEAIKLLWALFGILAGKKVPQRL